LHDESIIPGGAVIPRSPCDNGSCGNTNNGCVLMGVCDESRDGERIDGFLHPDIMFIHPDVMQWDLNRQTMYEDNIPPTGMIIQK
jgi:hypothetical protein